LQGVLSGDTCQQHYGRFEKICIEWSFVGDLYLILLAGIKKIVEKILNKIKKETIRGVMEY